ncbi:hypothetical protein J4X73_05970 [Escherichia coli]
MLDFSLAKVRKSAEALRIIFHGTLIYSGKDTKARAELALANGWSDLIGFGRPYSAKSRH